MPHSFKEYLQTKIKHPKGLADHLAYQEHFMKWLEDENLTVESCEYVDLLNYVKLLKQKERSTHTLNCYVQGVRYYYEYLQSKVAKQTGTEHHLRRIPKRLSDLWRNNHRPKAK